ncbi:MAG: hypothetical protein JO295_12425 [Verrucomicrobia bacterium]|nr:hypothetical protein [Verrucomicrobiota bacterium]
MQSDKVILLLLFAAGAMLNTLFKKGGLLEQWRTKKSADAQRARTAPSQPSQEQDAELRKLLEALGRPTTDFPPPPLPPAPVWRPPVLTARPPVQPDFLPPVRRLPPPPLPSPSTPPPPVPAGFPSANLPESARARRRAEKRKKKSAPFLSPELPPATAQSPPLLPVLTTVVRRQRAVGELRARLTAPGSVRQAIVLAEILGPPRALRLPAANGQFT